MVIIKVMVTESRFEEESFDRLGEIIIHIAVDFVVIKHFLDHSFDVK